MNSPCSDAAAAQAMILAAGRGQRMRPLTDTCPKPLLPLHGQPLMRWHMQALTTGGFARQVVNVAWLGGQIVQHFSHPEALPPGCTLRWSREDLDFGRGLETAGGIARALPMLDEAFWVVAGDIYIPEFEFTQQEMQRFAASGKLAHLWLVPNPPQHPQGDFALAQGLAADEPPPGQPRLTFAAIGLYRRALFLPPWCALAPGNPQGESLALAPLLRRAMVQGLVSATRYDGRWEDVGTPQRLAALQATG